MKEKDLTLWKQNGCFAQSAEIKQGYRYGKIQNWKTFPYIVQNANRKHWLKQKNYKWLLSKSQTHKTQSRWTSEYVIWTAPCQVDSGKNKNFSCQSHFCGWQYSYATHAKCFLYSIGVIQFRRFWYRWLL